MNAFRRLAIAAFLISVSATPVVAGTRYSAQDLGLGEAYAVNNLGVVVGRDVNGQAVLWMPDGSVMNLGARLPGDLNSVAADINDAGQVVGWTRTQTRSFAWNWSSRQGLRGLPNPISSDQDGFASSVNNKGDIAGYVGSGGVPIIWHADGSTSLLTGLSGYGWASAINERGQVAFTLGLSPYDAMLWDPGSGVTNLGNLNGAVHSITRDLNSAGAVVGISDDAAFVWTAAAGIQALTTPLNASRMDASAINEAGLIVGWADTPSGGVALWRANDGIPSFDSFVEWPNAEFPVLWRVADINDRGQILVVAGDSATLGDAHSLLLSPVPEPKTALLVLAGLAAAVARRLWRATP